MITLVSTGKVCCLLQASRSSDPWAVSSWFQCPSAHPHTLISLHPTTLPGKGKTHSQHVHLSQEGHRDLIPTKPSGRTGTQAEQKRPFTRVGQVTTRQPDITAEMQTEPTKIGALLLWHPCGKLLWLSFLIFHGADGKESVCNVGDLGLIPWLGRFPGGGNGYPLQYSGLENSMDCVIHGLQRVRHDWATATVPWKVH